MSPFVIAAVALWSVPLLATGYLIAKYAYEAWDEQRWHEQENRAMDLLRRWTLEQDTLERLEALWEVPTVEPNRRPR